MILAECTARIEIDDSFPVKFRMIIETRNPNWPPDKSSTEGHEIVIPFYDLLSSHETVKENVILQLMRSFIDIRKKDWELKVMALLQKTEVGTK